MKFVIEKKTIFKSLTHLQSIVDRFGGENAAESKYGSDGLFQRASKGFMGKTWDGGSIAFSRELWEECLRVVKHGGYLCAFSSTRTVFRMGVAIEDSGWIIRDMISWIYSSGFPKSLDISKAIDRHLGKFEDRKVIGQNPNIPNITGYRCNTFSEFSDAIENNNSAETIRLPSFDGSAGFDGGAIASIPAAKFFNCFLARSITCEKKAWPFVL